VGKRSALKSLQASEVTVGDLPMSDEGQLREALGSQEERIRRLVQELEEIHRNIAISFHAGLEEAIRNAILAAFHTTGEESTRILGGLETPGVLGFSDQCKLAHCLGLISADMLKDLKRLTRVRNRFAHTSGAVSFKDPKISGLCDALWTPKIFPVIVGHAPPQVRRVFEKHAPSIDYDPAMRYLTACMVIVDVLRYETSMRVRPSGPVMGSGSLSQTAPDQPAPPPE
jgi:DNA-binding MltR family transcriptional regulator